MSVYDCLACVDGMMPAGIDPLFGPVYRICPHCHTECSDCDGLAMFPAIGDYTLDAVLAVLYELDFDVYLCDWCNGIEGVYPATSDPTSGPAAPHLSDALGITAPPTSTSDNDRRDDDADTIRRVENVLRDLADAYYTTRKQYEEITASGDATAALRAFYCAEFATFAEIGNQLAYALGIAPPNWQAMCDLAKRDSRADHPEPGVNP